MKFYIKKCNSCQRESNPVREGYNRVRYALGHLAIGDTAQIGLYITKLHLFGLIISAYITAERPYNIYILYGRVICKYYTDVRPYNTYRCTAVRLYNHYQNIKTDRQIPVCCIF